MLPLGEVRTSCTLSVVPPKLIPQAGTILRIVKPLPEKITAREIESVQMVAHVNVRPAPGPQVQPFTAQWFANGAEFKQSVDFAVCLYCLSNFNFLMVVLRKIECNSYII